MSFNLSNLPNGGLGMAKTVGVSASVRAMSAAIKANTPAPTPNSTVPVQSEGERGKSK